MKKIISIFLAAAMTVPMLCACGKTQDSGETDVMTYDQIIETDWSQYVAAGDYSKIELDMYPDATDKEVESELDQLLYDQSDLIEITERKSQKGDTVNIDFVGKMDGETFSGGTASNFDLELGAGGFIAGFEDGLIGYSAGDEVTLNLTFPDPYPNNTAFSGKPVVFEVKINKVTNRLYPELNDEFIASNSDYKTIEEFKTGSRKELEEEKHKNMVLYKTNYIFNSVVEKSTFAGSYPETLYNKYYKMVIETYEQYAKEADTELDDYLSKMGTTREGLEDYAKSYASSFTEQYVLFFRIAQIEDLFIKNEEEYKTALAEYAAETGTTAEELEDQNPIDDVKIAITIRRVINLLTENTVETGEYSDGTTEAESSNKETTPEDGGEEKTEE